MDWGIGPFADGFGGHLRVVCAPSCCPAGLALFIDGIDGWLARWSTVAKVLPRFSGERLDLIVDYLNYVVVPAFVIIESGRLGSGAGELGAGLMILSSLYHFADQSSKTSDGFFIGFPALCNVVIFYFFCDPRARGRCISSHRAVVRISFCPFEMGTLFPCRDTQTAGCDLNGGVGVCVALCNFKWISVGDRYSDHFAYCRYRIHYDWSLANPRDR